MSDQLKGKEDNISINDYLGLEEGRIVKHEYYQGRIVQLPENSFEHSVIVTNIIGALFKLLSNKEGNKYQALSNNLKVFIPSQQCFVYPDVLIIEQPPQFFGHKKEALLNPVLVVEVLSPRTLERDLGTKFLLYSEIPSFREYIVVDQRLPSVSTFFRANENTWKEGRYKDIDDPVALRSLDAPLAMRDIYKGLF